MNSDQSSNNKQIQYLSYDKNYIVRSISTSPLTAEGQKSLEIVSDDNLSYLIGRKVPYDMLSSEDLNKKENSELRVAIVCNWNDKCGISTYTQYLVDAMKGKVSDLRIFSETTDDQTGEDEEFVSRCWSRGENLLPLAEQILDWNPDYIIIQHEFGIFPNAFHFMQFMEAIDKVPYVVAMHSVYEHLDKLVYIESCKNIVVHSEAGRKSLKRLGNTSNIEVIPHGCIDMQNTDELWNIMQSPYTLMQFGFGFGYKGVDRVIRAVSHLKKTDPKFENLFYFYLCSTNSHNLVSHNDYYGKLIALAEEEGVRDNIAIFRKYQTEEMLSLYLRLAKAVVFPYIVNGDNKVYGASGAIRIAMAHGKPVIASESHLFDDLEGVVPRPTNYLDLAAEIDEIFSNDEHRSGIVAKSKDYVLGNSWGESADRYLMQYSKIYDRNIMGI